MIFLLLTFLLAQEPDLSTKDESFIDELDQELLELSIEEIPEVKLDAYGELPE